MPNVSFVASGNDEENATKIESHLQLSSKGDAVGVALSLTACIVDQLLLGKELLLGSPNGDLERVVMRELDVARRNS